MHGNRSILYRVVFIVGCFLVGSSQAWSVPSSCASHQPSSSSKNFAGQTISTRSFAGQDLRNADFSNATLLSSSFEGAVLTGANFSGAIFGSDPKAPYDTPDFTGAQLDISCFAKAKFSAVTVFTDATLSCADFSNTDITNAVFGDDPLKAPIGDGCRLSFAHSTMSCEFISDWAQLDLSNANVTACLKDIHLVGADFSNAQMPGIDFTSADLSKTKFVKADLTDATLNGATLNGVRFNGAKLDGLRAQNSSMIDADLSGSHLSRAHLDNANLTHAVLYEAVLFDNSNGSARASASLQGAHLRDVNLSGALLDGVDFTGANFYTSCPVEKNCHTQQFNCYSADGKTPGRFPGPTNECATANSAELNQAVFNGAYMAEVDLSNAKGSAVDFSNAYLMGANMSGMTLGSSADGTVTRFDGAYLQGVNFGQDFSKWTGDVNLRDAFFDFVEGNELYVQLDGNKHNAFRCDLCNSKDVCIGSTYKSAIAVPRTPHLTCPDGSLGPCGKVPGPDEHPKSSTWRSPQDPPGAWYAVDSTFTPAVPATGVCTDEPEKANKYW